MQRLARGGPGRRGNIKGTTNVPTFWNNAAVNPADTNRRQMEVKVDCCCKGGQPDCGENKP